MTPKRFGAICGPGASHVAAMSAIGRELESRGHQFTLFRFPSSANQTLPGGPLQERGLVREPRVATNGQGSSPGDTRVSEGKFLLYMVERARLVSENAPPVLQVASLDCVMADSLDPGVASVAEMLGIPYVTINNALPLNAESLVPPDFLSWRFHTATWTQAAAVLEEVAVTRRPVLA
jgi:zeaxanthin glucosyltransferase